MLKENRKIRILIAGIMFFLLLMTPFSYAISTFGFSSSSSNPQYYQPSFSSYSLQQAYTYWPALKESDKCESKVDFMMFVQPGSCEPSVVRSDLLEEQNVPVFCKVDMVKLNPLVDISQIKSVKYTAKEGNDYVVDVSFHPNQEAIKAQKGYFDKPLINDAGYVVVLLKRQESEEKMPDSVKINITAVLSFSLENFFGAGKNNYYLEVLDDKEWENNYNENVFWKGKGYLRAEWIVGNEAEIAIYKDKDEKIASFRLEKGKTSDVFYMPGFYCKAGLQVRLDDITAGVKKVLLEVDGNKIWLIEGEKFLDGLCQVTRISFGDERKVDNNKIERTNTVKVNCGGKSQELTYVEEKIPEGKNVIWKAKQIAEDEIKNAEITQDSKIIENFNEAEKYTRQIISEYGTAASGEGELTRTWGANALVELAELADKIGLKIKAIDLYSELKEKYPDYAGEAEEKIKQIYTSSPIGYKEHYIRLLEIYTPSKEKASADFKVWKLENGARKSQIGQEETSDIQESDMFVQEGGEKKFKLSKLYKDKVEFEYSGTRYTLTEGKSIYVPDNNNKKKSTYEIKLENVDLEEIAKVSLISKLPNEYSESDFSLEIGIEKRAIKLTPEMAKERIENLNKSIEKWEKILFGLGNVVKGMKAACLVTSTYLLAKNFIQNLGGGATARQAVMPMYYNKCEGEAKGDEGKFNSCLVKYETDIEKDIEAYKKVIEPINDKIIEIQKANKDKSGYVDSKIVVAVLKTEYPTAFSEVKDKEMSIEQARSLIETSLIASSGATKTLNDFEDKKKEGIIQELEKVKVILGNELYQGNDDWWNKVKVRYYSGGTGDKKVRIAPIPKEYNGKRGFYVYVPDGYYEKSGDFTGFFIGNIGEDGIVDENGDKRMLITRDMFYKEPGFYKDIDPFNLDTEGKQFRQLILDSINVIKTTNLKYGEKNFRLLDKIVSVDVKKTIAGEKRCTDFMSPTDCSLLFNVCDPVLCPSSRCDLGGNYRVDNVISSGIIGSLVLCLNNFGSPEEGKVLVPVCLSGVHAGLDNLIVIMKEYRDCLQERINTGKYIGFCDEIYSLYLCDFFWRQSGPMLDVLFSDVIGNIQGQGMKGGGEYSTIKDSWDNLKNTVEFMKDDYAINALNAFEARTQGEIGGEFCKMFISARYPSSKKFFDNLLAPESPVQFQAWFDEMSYSTVTVPATSQYKVYYHIYAGKDEGINYQVYLTSPTDTAYVNVQDVFVVATNFLPKGGYYSETKDFTAPAGYKKLCVRINGKDECGFGKVSSGFALNYLSDKYYEEQASEKVTTEEECVSGTPSAYSLLQPNIQAGVEEVISPELEKKGIIRICSTKQPDEQTDKERWKNVGYCDDPKLICWLDLDSVKEVIKNKGIEQQITGDVSGKDLKVKVETPVKGIEDEKVKTIFDNAKKMIDNIKNTKTFRDDNVNVLISNLKEVRDEAMDITKAEAGYYQFKIYATMAEVLWLKEKELEKAKTPATTTPQTKKETEIKETRPDCSKCGDLGDVVLFDFNSCDVDECHNIDGCYFDSREGGQCLECPLDCEDFELRYLCVEEDNDCNLLCTWDDSIGKCIEPIEGEAVV